MKKAEFWEAAGAVLGMLAFVFLCAFLLGASLAACMGVFSILFGKGAPLVRAAFAAQVGAVGGGLLGLGRVAVLLLEKE